MTTDPAGGGLTLRLPAHAKLNLALRVLAREESGFHSIESISKPHPGRGSTWT